jgi:LmbE family N-acetylglucosaminyl deacetylase
MILATILLLILTAAAGWLRVRNYRKRVRLPVSRADRLECRGNHRILNVSVHPTGIDVPPDLELRGRTVLAYMTVRSRLLGHLFDPFIEMQLGEHTLRQYFERGCNGARYLNLTHLLSMAGERRPERIQLRSGFLRWPSTGSLLIFEPPSVDASSTLVLAPHPDDAEAAAFGLFSHHESCIATVTAGELATGTMPGWLAAQSRSHWTAALRVADSLRATVSARGRPIKQVSLVFPDGSLESMYLEPARPRRLGCEATLQRSLLRSTNVVPQFQSGAPDCRWSDLVADLRVLLELTNPRTIICPHPLLDGHSDHVFTAVALEEALRGIQGQPPTLLLYVVHNRGAPLHPPGPMSSVASVTPGSSAQWMAASIYSHPLPPCIQQAKFFALEAMHAVRLQPDVQPWGAVKLVRSIKHSVSSYLLGLAPHPASLLRRACRPDEIFYIVAAEELRELIERLPASAARNGSAQHEAA